MSYSPVSIANYFIDKALIEGEAMDHMRLQKLIYMAHGWNLAAYGTPLISEKVQAWKFGPVIPSVYHKFKRYGNGDIIENGVGYRDGKPFVPNIDPGDSQTRELLNSVWDSYRRFSGIQLSKLTHQPNTPWEKSWKHAAGRKSVTIPDGKIEQHFRTMASGTSR